MNIRNNYIFFSLLFLLFICWGFFVHKTLFFVGSFDDKLVYGVKTFITLGFCSLYQLSMNTPFPSRSLDLSTFPHSLKKKRNLIYYEFSL